MECPFWGYEVSYGHLRERNDHFVDREAAVADAGSGTEKADFAIAGRHRLEATSPAAAALDYAYAERVAFVGAPLLDLRTLPELDYAVAVELAAVPELSW